MLRLASDFDVHGDIIRGLHRRLPEIHLVRAQDVLPDGTSDPEVLAWAAAENRILITNDRNTMVGFAYQRVKQDSRYLASSPRPTSSPLAKRSTTSCSLRSTCRRKRSGTRLSCFYPFGDSRSTRSAEAGFHG
jgi:hypothetical protein